MRKRLVYVVAGEASGDAIGSKLIRSLKNTKLNGSDTCFTFRGVGGYLAQMMKEGKFTSLFPMKELSFMGIAEVIPKIWTTLHHLCNVVKDIEASRPDAVITIDSKGFNFRLLHLLNRQGTLYHLLRLFGQVGTEPLRDKVALVHYVAPSTWAYKHKFKKIGATAIGLSKLFDHMLVILPFEQRLFQPKSGSRACVTFVGHPALEDFCERHGLFERNEVESASFENWQNLYSSMAWNASPWYTDLVSNDFKSYLIHQSKNATHTGLNTFTICALVGSRENEVLQTIDLVKAAIDKFTRSSDAKVQVVFPTISSLAPLIQHHLKTWEVPFVVQVDDDTSSKNSIYQASTIAIAVSGTVVLETTLAGLPTIVIYRANRLTEVLAKYLARVNYVSIPNIMSSKELIPELLFTNCTSDNIYSAIRKMEQEVIARNKEEISQKEVELCHALSSLIRWTEGPPTPQKASAIAAQVVIEEINKKQLHK